MKKRYNTSFRERILEYIQNFPAGVILRSNLKQLGEPRQISRILKNFTEDGCLVKLGYGIYAKAETSKYTDKPLIKVGFTNAAIEALNRLGIKWQLGKAIKDYNLGKTTQIPARLIIRLKSRFRGTISDGCRELIFEDDVYAR
jgi:hypothetical protein